MARNRAEQRPREAARRRQVAAELIADGVDPQRARRIAYGKRNPNDPRDVSLRDITAARKRTSEPIAAVTTRLGWQRNYASRAPTADVFSWAGGVSVNTNRGGEAYRVLREAARNRHPVVVIGTRADGDGVPINRAQYMSATILMNTMSDLLGTPVNGSNIKRALALFYPQRDPRKASPVTRVSIEIQTR